MRAFSYSLLPWFYQATDIILNWLETLWPNVLWLEQFSGFIRDNLIESNFPKFAHTMFITSFIIFILLLTLFKRRFWCRYLCPLGALLGCAGKFSRLRRTTEKCPGSCRACSNLCRVNAIRTTGEYLSQECIVCLDCVEKCPRQKSKFGWRNLFSFSAFHNTLSQHKIWSICRHSGPAGSRNPVPSRVPALGRPQSFISKTFLDPVLNPNGMTLKKHILQHPLYELGGHGNNQQIASSSAISRGTFLSLISAGFLAAGFWPKRVLAGSAIAPRPVLRPPGAALEAEFKSLCIRCGNCLKICLTNVLQPCMLDSGWDGIWTPKLNFPHSYCEYQCNLCGRVCPTQAMRPLSLADKLKTKLGRARINRSACIPWATGKNCLVCEEHCPVEKKAIVPRILKIHGQGILKLPLVDAALCVGCGICENKCPARPRAIFVEPL
jgi:ferredoxin